jgi:hypothetical protein
MHPNLNCFCFSFFLQKTTVFLLLFLKFSFFFLHNKKRKEQKAWGKHCQQPSRIVWFQEPRWLMNCLEEKTFFHCEVAFWCWNLFLFANCFLFVSWGNYIPVTIPNPSVDIHRTLPNFWSIFSSHWRPSPRCCWRHLHEGVTTLELVLVDERCPLEKVEFTKDVSSHFTDPELKPENTSPTTVQQWNW